MRFLTLHTLQRFSFVQSGNFACQNYAAKLNVAIATLILSLSTGASAR